MNIIGKLFEKYCAWIAGWSPAHFGFFVQAVLLLGLPVLLCSGAFHRGSRSVFVQVAAFTAGMLLATAIPVEQFIPRQPVLKTWIFTFCLMLLIFLPGILPRLLTPQLGKQKKLQAILYIILAGLFLANLFTGGGQ
jgi:hypothetical protein